MTCGLGLASHALCFYNSVYGFHDQSQSDSSDCVQPMRHAALFPKFKSVFEEVRNQGAFHLLAHPPEEATRALVMENRGDMNVIALRYDWVMTNRDGKVRKRTVSCDSYHVADYHAVLRAKERKLISRLGAVDESLIDHVLAGGGAIAGADSWNLTNVAAFPIFPCAIRTTFGLKTTIDVRVAGLLL